MIQLGLIGYPLGHSLSSKIHKAALDSCGLRGEYSLFPIPLDDTQGLENLLERVRSGELTGLNVTIPHKQNVIPLLDELTPTASAIGAANTISMQNGKLTGDNTDASGFLADLNRFLKNQKSSIVLGAGGSARAVVYALINDGWEVTIITRRIQQAQALIGQFSNLASRMTSTEYRSTASYSPPTTFSLIINTTPVGMSPNVGDSPWPSDQPFPPNAAVYDLVYNPRETKLVKDARAAGLPAVTGLGMLIEQAALSFEIWTGCNVPRESLFAAVEES
jgi:shikimate dehydrogenase